MSPNFVVTYCPCLDKEWGEDDLSRPTANVFLELVVDSCGKAPNDR